jgi:hypothetical protein
MMTKSFTASLGPQAGGAATLVLFYLDIIAFICLIGTGAGIQLGRMRPFPTRRR